jgi:hypothetical protein
MTTLLPIRLPISKPIRDLRLEPGSRMTIASVTWDEFEEILEEMGDRWRSLPERESGLVGWEFGGVGRSGK